LILEIEEEMLEAKQSSRTWTQAEVETMTSVSFSAR
jgi:hypothetical protein